MEQDPKKRPDVNKIADQGADQETVPANLPTQSSSEDIKEGDVKISVEESADTSIAQEKTQLETKIKKNKKNEVGRIRRIRTYKEDIAEAVRAQKASLTSITAAEQKRRAGIAGDIIKKPTDFKKIGVTLGSIIFITLGVGIIGFFAFFYEKEEVAIEQNIPSFIFVEEQREVDATGKNAREILQILGVERVNISLPLGQVAHLYVTEKIQGQEKEVTHTLSTEEFFERIRAQVSSAFLRSLDSSFVLGVHVFNQNQPFIILKSNSYQHSFAGFLEWERTIYNDLFLFMGRKIDSGLGVVLDPQTGEEIVLRESFEDKIIRNIDVRALISESGNIEFLYAFPDQKTIIITTNENTLIEVITRINSVRVF